MVFRLSNPRLNRSRIWRAFAPAALLGLLALAFAGMACWAAVVGHFGAADAAWLAAFAAVIAGGLLAFIEFFAWVYPLTGFLSWSALIERVTQPAANFSSRILRAAAPPPRTNPAI